MVAADNELDDAFTEILHFKYDENLWERTLIMRSQINTAFNSD